jgi:hypothetical protein
MNAEHRKLLFVVGVGRSGTTLTQLLLAAHPRISFLPEINFIRRYLFTGYLSRLLRDNGLAAVHNELRHDPKFQRLQVPIESLVSAAETHDIARDIFNQIIGRYASDSADYVGYKDARLIEDPIRVLKEWPDCQIIHVYRDPRDVLASRKKAGWSRNYPAWRNLVAGRIQLDIARKCSQSEFRDRFFEVQYEELLNDPEKFSRDICGHLGLEFCSEMLDFNSRAKDLVFDDELQWKDNLFSPLIRNNTGKWKTQLTRTEAALVERTFNRMLAERGYLNSKCFDTLSLARRLYVLFIRAWIEFCTSLYLLKRQLAG